MHAISIIKYDHPKQPIFIVDYLSDRAFDNGFRIHNPEKHVSPSRVQAGLELLNEFLNDLDMTEFLSLPIQKPRYLNRTMDPNRRSV